MNTANMPTKNPGTIRLVNWENGQYYNYRLPIRFSFRSAVSHFYRGYFVYKYPLCCVLNFILLDIAGLPAAAVMDSTFGSDEERVGYVQCIKCRKSL